MEGLSAALVYVGIGSVLAVGVAIFAVAVVFLQTARRYVDLAEERLELLREGEALLLQVARQQDRVSEESRERGPQRGERIPEAVGRPLGRRTGEGSVGGFPRPEGLDLHAREERSVREQASSAVPPDEGQERTTKVATSGGTASRPKEGAPTMGVKLPHPDDDVTPRVWNSSATSFFQKKYDLYLEHYEGSVRLAERLHRMRAEAGPGSDTAEGREWEDKLRRAHAAIGRTAQRLDLLEVHYPELATDGDRLSARIGIARLHAELAERFGS